MSKNSIINSIRIVDGCDIKYEVGCDGVTRITEDFTSDVNGDAMRCSFLIGGNKGLIAEISSNIPFILTYKEKESEVEND